MKVMIICALVFSLTFAMPQMPVMAQETEMTWELENVLSEVEYADVTEYISGNYTYILNEDGTATISLYTVTDVVDVVVPTELDGHTVSAIGERAFFRTKIKSVTIPGCIKTIGKGAFYDSYVEYVTLEEGVENILQDAFFEVPLQKINIPASVTNIEETAFDEIRDSIEVHQNSTSYKVVDDALLTFDGKLLLVCWTDKTEYTIPEGVIRIGNESFIGKHSVINLTIPDCVTEIGDSAFFYSKIASVNIGKGVTSIEHGAFMCCSKLETITIPGNVNKLADSVFWMAGLKSVVLEEGIEDIGDYAFYECVNLENIVFPASVTSIGEGLFRNCALLGEIKVTEGNTAYKVVDGAVLTTDGTKMAAYPPARKEEVLIVPDGVKEIGSYMFENNTILKHVEMPDTLEILGHYCFNGCENLEAVLLAGNVAKITANTFSNCVNLKSIYIPSTVIHIGQQAFDNCNSLETIYYVGSEADWKKIVFIKSGNDVLNSATVYYMSNLRLFVERMYTVALGRDADSVGLNNWVQMLVEGTHDGAGLAKEFILGEEFALRNLSNEEYVDVLYATFFDREADLEGKNLWVSVLTSGQSREYVLSQFVNLDEFTLLCAEYEINRGVMFTDGEVATPGMTSFVSRLYDLVLGRSVDNDGLYVWTYALTMQMETAESAAKNFFNGQEYALKNVDNTTYIKDLYGVFMNREADEAGLAYWEFVLSQGFTRDYVLSEFAKSEEFKAIAKSYGLE